MTGLLFFVEPDCKVQAKVLTAQRKGVRIGVSPG
jgi:hypothetical protein